MTSKRTIPKVKTFGAELLAVFKAASEETIIIVLENKQKAIQLRARLNSLRVAMRNEDHWMQPLADRVQVTMKREIITKIRQGVIPTGNWIVSCKPSDNDFVTAIEQAIGKPISEVLAGETEKGSVQDQRESNESLSPNEEEFSYPPIDENTSIADLIEEMTGKESIVKEIEKNESKDITHKNYQEENFEKKEEN